MSWSLLSSLGPSGRGGGEHERLRTERGYYPLPHAAAAPHSHQLQRASVEYQQHARLAPPAKPPDKPPVSHSSHVSHSPHAPHAGHSPHAPHATHATHGLPKGEPNFAAYGYQAYRAAAAYDKKDGHLPAPPPLVPESGNSVIVKHDAKQHPYASKPRSEPGAHYGLPPRPYRAGLSPHAPPHHPPPAPPAQQQDKGRARHYRPAPPRSPAYYAAPPAPPTKSKVSSPAPPHMYGKPGSSPAPAHYGVAVEPPPHAKTEPPPVPYPPPSAYSSALRTRPPPAAHHNPRTPEPRPPPRAHGASPPAALAACQTQPLDLGVSSREDPERLSPRRRFPFDPAPDQDAKRRRLESEPTSRTTEPLIASAAATAPGRTPHGSEPAPQAPGPLCDVRVPSADGSIETPEKAAGASPAPSCTPSASPAPATAAPPVASSPPASAAPPAPPATPPAPAGSPAPAPSPKDGAPVRHLGKKAWLQRHETAPVGEGDCSGGGGVCVTLPMTVATRPPEPAPAPTPTPTPTPTPALIAPPVAVESVRRSSPEVAARPKTATKTRKPVKETNGRLEDDDEDTSSSERESIVVPKRKPPKAKRKKGANSRKNNDEPKKKKASESGSESEKESDDKDSDSGGSGSGSGSTSGRRGGGGRARGRRARGGGGAGRGGKKRDEPPRRGAAARARTASGESFLQNGPCFEVAPRLAKCRECRWSPAQRDKDMPNIFCRFYAFRRLKYAKNRQLAIAGFSDPYKDAEEVCIILFSFYYTVTYYFKLGF